MSAPNTTQMKIFAPNGAVPRSVAPKNQSALLYKGRSFTCNGCQTVVCEELWQCRHSKCYNKSMVNHICDESPSETYDLCTGCYVNPAIGSSHSKHPFVCITSSGKSEPLCPTRRQDLQHFKEQEEEEKRRVERERQRQREEAEEAERMRDPQYRIQKQLVLQQQEANRLARQMMQQQRNAQWEMQRQQQRQSQMMMFNQQMMMWRMQQNHQHHHHGY